MRFKDPMDPANVEPFDVRFRDRLAGDTIATIDAVTLSARALDAGVELGTGLQAPQVISDPETGEALSTVRFTLLVASGKHGSAAFNRNGLTAAVTIHVTTAGGSELEYTVEVMIRNQ